MEQKRLLIVDDNELLHILGKSFLKRQYYLLDSAHSGSEALKKAVFLKPDLVLLDYEMKDMNGCEVCQKLKSDPDTQHIPVIIFSSHESDDSREKCLAAGCRAFLIKPIQREHIVNVVEDVLNETQRSVARVLDNLVVAIRIHDREESATVRSLSVEGAFIVMPGPPKPGERFYVTFSTLGSLVDIPILVEVAWLGRRPESGETGVGVKFLELGYLEKELLTRYVMRKLQQTETVAY